MNLHTRLASRLLIFICLAQSVAGAAGQASASSQLGVLQRALDAAQRGELDNALRLDNELLERSPSLLPALKLRGTLLEQLGRLNEADEAYARAVRLAPRDADLRMQRAELALQRNADLVAIEELNEYCRLRPADAAGFFYLAQAMHRNGQSDKAMIEIRHAIRLDPKNASFLQKLGEWMVASGSLHDGTRILEQAQKIDSHLEGIDLDLGFAVYYDLDYSRAAAKAETALERAPNDAAAMRLLASCREQLADWRGALVAYRRLSQSDPTDARAQLGVGHAQLELGDWEGASEPLQQALRLDPALAKAHFYLAHVYAVQGKKDEQQHELELYQQMIRYAYAPSALDQETGREIWQQATAQILAGREAEAIALLAGAIKDKQVHTGGEYVLAGSLCLSLSRWEQGESLLRRALELDPDVRGAHTYLGLAALEEEDLDQAESQFEQELILHANYLPALEGMAEVRYRQQRWDEVERLLTQAHSTNPRAQYQLVDACFHLGRLQDAKLNAEMAAAYSHSDADALRAIEDLLRHNRENELADKIAGQSKPK